jgi:hypothetical protein
MLKYKIEGNIDFYAELYKSLDIEENEEKTEEDNNLCLISNQPLTDTYVQLICGHKFNYMPLYLDIKNHKQLFNSLEGTATRLNIDEIRCPYCRKKQKGVLPYYPDIGLKTHGVNYINPSIKYNTITNEPIHYCEFLTPNPDYIEPTTNTVIYTSGNTLDASGNTVDMFSNIFDSSGNYIQETNITNSGNCKYFKCFNTGNKISLSNLNGYNYGDEKCYCWKHKKIMVKKYVSEKNNKSKEEVKQIKLKAKEEAKLKKQEDKAIEKALEKANKKKMAQNIVLGATEILVEHSEIIGCQTILKSGINKGCLCGCKIVSENMCKRHLK